MYVSAVLSPPWDEGKPKAFAQFVGTKYGVSTYTPSCVSAVSEAQLGTIVTKEIDGYKPAPIVAKLAIKSWMDASPAAKYVETGWTGAK